MFMQMRNNRRSYGGGGGGSSSGGGGGNERFPWVALIPVLLGVVFIGLVIHCEDQAKEKARNQWSVVVEGVVDHVEYGQYNEERSVGAGPVHHLETFVMDVTVIYFQDGRSYVAEGRHDMPFPRGTSVRIWRNGLGDYSIEKIQ